MLLKRELGSRTFYWLDDEPVSDAVFKIVFALKEELMAAQDEVRKLSERLDGDGSERYEEY